MNLRVSAVLCENLHFGLSPTATVFLSRYTVALHSVPLCHFQDLFGRRRRIAPHPLRTALQHLPFQLLRTCRTSSCLLEGVAVQRRVAATLSPVALQWATKPGKQKIGVKELFGSKNLKLEGNPTILGVNFGGEFFGEPETLEKQGRKIRREHSLRNLWAILQ